MNNRKNLIIFDATCHIPEAHIKGRRKEGRSACGVLIITSRREEFQYKRYLGEMTPPVAEFKALIFALDKAAEVIKRNEDIEVRGDSELVIKWMTGNFRLKKQHIKPLFDEAKKMESRFQTNIQYYYQPRNSKYGKIAHRLAQDAYEQFIKGEE